MFRPFLRQQRVQGARPWSKSVCFSLFNRKSARQIPTNIVFDTVILFVLSSSFPVCNGLWKMRNNIREPSFKLAQLWAHVDHGVSFANFIVIYDSCWISSCWCKKPTLLPSHLTIAVFEKMRAFPRNFPIFFKFSSQVLCRCFPFI